MKEPRPLTIQELNQDIALLSQKLKAFKPSKSDTESAKRKFTSASGALIVTLTELREELSPVRFGNIDVTLGNPKSIAKFFTFNFITQPRQPLADVVKDRFYGAGVYAIYYHGKSVPAYGPLSGTETPIYVGKADPDAPYAETTEKQGEVLYKRLKEHARNIEKTNLDLKDFTCRQVAIQSGMQAAVEHFMIRFYRPIWNKEIKVCFGIGKHGDSAKTRANKRSPWDTMHPGRKWAEKTIADQKSRESVEEDIRKHFKTHPPIPDLDTLLEKLSLG